MVAVSREGLGWKLSEAALRAAPAPRATAPTSPGPLPRLLPRQPHAHSLSPSMALACSGAQAAMLPPCSFILGPPCSPTSRSCFLIIGRWESPKETRGEGALSTLRVTL